MNTDIRKLDSSVFRMQRMAFGDLDFVIHERRRAREKVGLAEEVSLWWWEAKNCDVGVISPVLTKLMGHDARTNCIAKFIRSRAEKREVLPYNAHSLDERR